MHILVTGRLVVPTLWRYGVTALQPLASYNTDFFGVLQNAIHKFSKYLLRGGMSNLLKKHFELSGSFIGSSYYNV